MWVTRDVRAAVGGGGGLLRFGPWTLDLDRELLHGPAGPCRLRPQSLFVLRVLLERAPAVVGFAELLAIVWGRRVVSRSALPQAMREIRRALGEAAAAPRCIETRARRGYRVVVPVHRSGRAPVDIELPCATAGRVAGAPRNAANDDGLRAVGA